MTADRNPETLKAAFLMNVGFMLNSKRIQQRALSKLLAIADENFLATLACCTHYLRWSKYTECLIYLDGLSDEAKLNRPILERTARCYAGLNDRDGLEDVQAQYRQVFNRDSPYIARLLEKQGRTTDT